MKHLYFPGMWNKGKKESGINCLKISIRWTRGETVDVVDKKGGECCKMKMQFWCQKHRNTPDPISRFQGPISRFQGPFHGSIMSSFWTGTLDAVKEYHPAKVYIWFLLFASVCLYFSQQKNTFAFVRTYRRFARLSHSAESALLSSLIFCQNWQNLNTWTNLNISEPKFQKLSKVSNCDIFYSMCCTYPGSYSAFCSASISWDVGKRMSKEF